MTKPRKVYVQTWIFGGDLYAVSTRIDGRLMETVLCAPGKVLEARARAWTLWSAPGDIVDASPVPELAGPAGSLPGLIVIFDLLKLVKAVS